MTGGSLCDKSRQPLARLLPPPPLLACRPCFLCLGSLVFEGVVPLCLDRPDAATQVL